MSIVAAIWKGEKKARVNRWVCRKSDIHITAQKGLEGAINALLGLDALSHPDSLSTPETSCDYYSMLGLC